MNEVSKEGDTRDVLEPQGLIHRRQHVDIVSHLVQPLSVLRDRMHLSQYTWQVSKEVELRLRLSSARCGKTVEVAVKVCSTKNGTECKAILTGRNVVGFIDVGPTF